MPTHSTKIEYRAAATGGAAYTTLADEGSPTLAGKITGYQPKLAKSPFVQSGYGAAGITALDMGNQKWTLNFAIARQHGDEGAAVAFISTHAAALAALGNLDLRITTYTGIVYLPACALTEFSPDPASDQSSMIHYGFIGGNYTTTAP